MSSKKPKQQPKWAEDQFNNPPTASAVDTPPPTAIPETIPLNMLSVWQDNVRKAGRAGNIAELQASILAHGLINPLLVMRSDAGELTVICGNRRLMALRILCGEGKLPEDHPVPCQVIPETADAKELSTAENVVRERMHPLDEADAFRCFIEKGHTLDRIAQRFGVSETVVRKRLALANVSPAVKEALTAGKLSLAQAQAFTVSDDHKMHDKFLEQMEKDYDLSDGGTLDIDESDIRENLTEKKIPATDRRVRFVGIEAYKAAGGAVTLDLFAETEEDGAYLEEAKLLDALVRDRLDALKEQVKAEGWSFVKTKPYTLDWNDTEKYDQKPHKTAELSDADAIDMKAYKKELNALPDYFSNRSPAQRKRSYDLKSLIAALEEKKVEWPSKTKESSGVLIGLNHDGTPDIRRGLAPRQDKKKEKAEAKSSDKKTAKKAEKEVEGFPDDTLKKLAVHRSSAVSAALCGKSELALKAMAYRLVLDVFFDNESDLSCIDIDACISYTDIITKKGSIKGLAQLNLLDAEIRKTLPKKAEELWDWILKQGRPSIDDILAYCIAASLDDCDLKIHPHSAQLSEALNLKMSDWYTPTSENLFSHMGKPQLLTAIKEIRGAPTTPGEEKMGKDQLSKLAEKEAAAKKWLPHPLRYASPQPEKPEKKK